MRLRRIVLFPFRLKSHPPGLGYWCHGEKPLKVLRLIFSRASPGKTNVVNRRPFISLYMKTYLCSIFQFMIQRRWRTLETFLVLLLYYLEWIVLCRKLKKEPFCELLQFYFSFISSLGEWRNWGGFTKFSINNCSLYAVLTRSIPKMIKLISHEFI